MNRNKRKRRKFFSSKKCSHRARLGSESLEPRLPLTASGFEGNVCAPDLNLSALQDLSARPNQEFVLNLFDAGATVFDDDGTGQSTGDSIRLQLDPDDGPANATLSEDGEFRWTPNADQTGTFEFVVIAVDEGSPPLADAEVFTVTVRGNQVPDLADIADVDANPGEEVVVQLSATDPDGDNLTFTLDPDIAIEGATIQTTGDGQAELRFTPTAAQAGQSLEISVLVIDDGFPAMSDNETFMLNVGSVAASDDTFELGEADTLSVTAENGLLANDVTGDGGATVELVQGPANGTLDLADDGSFTYTAGDGFTGLDSFSYRAVSATGASTATVTIGRNNAPVVLDDGLQFDEGTSIDLGPEFGVLVNDSDPDGDALTASLVSGPDGLVIGADGSIQYTPDPDFSGILDITYAASDGISSTEGTLTITYVATNDAPTAGEDFYNTDEDTPLTIAAEAGVLVNDSDPEGDTLTASLVSDTLNGTVVLNSDGSFTYTPDANFTGMDQFTYEITDGNETTTGTACVEVRAINDAPEANPNTFAATAGVELVITADAGVLANDTDVDGDDLTATLVSGPNNGTLQLNTDGSFSYTPDADFSGPDSFRYQNNDGSVDSQPAVVAILVEAATSQNNPPVSLGDMFAATEGETLVVNAEQGVLANDSDPDGDDISAVLVDSPGQGTITLNPDGSFEYTPNNDSTGLDGFSYHITDGELTSATTLVVLTVTTTNDPPVATDDVYSVDEGGVLSVNASQGLLANDSDIDGDDLTATVVDGAQNGSFALNGDGSFSYTPNASFSGTDTVTYRITDGLSFSQPATVTINVSAQNAFTVSMTAAAGDSVGSVNTDFSFGSEVVYQFDDDSVADEIQLNADDHMTGDPSAPVVLVEYLDMECPACAAFHPIVSEIESRFDGDLLVVRRHLPLEGIHPNARAGAQAAEAAGQQGMFEEYTTLLFENQADWRAPTDPTVAFEAYATQLGLDLDQFRTDRANADLDAGITADANDALTLGAQGTPAFFLQNERIANPSSLEAFDSVIGSALANVDDVFAINRDTGEITVLDPTSLDDLGGSTTLSVLVKDASGNAETVEVTINVETSGGGTLSSGVDDAFADDDDWL